MPTTRILPDTADRGDAVQVSEQIAAIEAELADEAGGGVIELSSAPAAASGTRRRRGGRRKGPVLIAARDGRVLRAWCAFCVADHTHSVHGACPPGTCGCGLHLDLHGSRGPCTCPLGSGDGHRTAHCVGDSPFKDGGYWLREVER